MMKVSNLEVDDRNIPYIPVSDVVVDDNNMNAPRYLEDKQLSLSLVDDIVLKGFVDIVALCGASHVAVCSCQNDVIKEEFEKIFEEELDDLDRRGELQNNALVDARYDYAMERARKIVSDRCVKEQIRCPIEIRKLKQAVGYFNDKYDLTDPRIFIIVESLMNQMLTAHRMQLHSTVKGVVQRWYDKEGNERYSINPVEEVKLRYNEAKIKAIETLDKIMEGNKINIQGQVRVKDINDIFSNMVDIKEGEYKEV